MAGRSLNDMIARIALELGVRNDLAPGGAYPNVITNAIADAITIYQKQRFRWNEFQPLAPFQITLVPGQAYYGSAFDARIPQLYKIDYINYLLGATTMKMDRMLPEQIYLALLQGTTAGPPQEFAYDGNSLIFYPNPNIPYLLTVGGFMTVASPDFTTPAGLSDVSSPWTNEAERLIRSRAKYEIALHFTRNDKMVTAMSPAAGSGGASEVFFNELLSETNRIRGRGRVVGMRF